MAPNSSKFFERFRYDLLLGSIAAFYAFMAPYTKVEESFNVQAMHDILYHRHHIDNYDHLEFPGVVPRTFIGALVVSLLASPIVLVINLLDLPKIYGLFAVRVALGCIVLSTLRFFRVQIRNKFGHQVEAFYVIITAIQFHLLFYATRPLPNILALCAVNMVYGYWLKGNSYAALSCLIFATITFRCDMLLLLCPLGLEFLMIKSITLWEALKRCIGVALLCIGLTVLVDSILWKKLVWPEFKVFWFNSVLNRSSEWGTHPIYWYFTSALPRSLFAAYPLFLLGIFLDRRVLTFILPVLCFILLYSKLPHKELRFIISSVPMFNLSAAIAANRIYNNKQKSFWKLLYLIMLGLLLISLGCTVITFLASYQNYPSGDAIKELHRIGHLSNSSEHWVHIDPFSAMNGISRFCEHDLPWRYSKEEDIPLKELHQKKFTERPGKERKGWSITIHDLSGSPVAAASMVTPFVASPGSDRVSRSNPGSWLILRPGEGTWKPWGRLEAWRERGGSDGLGYRFELMPDTNGGMSAAGIVLAESTLNTHKGGKFVIDLGGCSNGRSTPGNSTSPACSPRSSGDYGYGLWPYCVYRGFVMAASVEGEGKCSKPTVEVSVQHVNCTEDAAAFVALAAAIDLSMDACRLFSNRLRKELCQPLDFLG